MKPNSGRAVVVAAGRRNDCFDGRLVLAAAGIDAAVERDRSEWRLLVRESDGQAAMAELAAYQAELAEQPQRRAAKIPTYSGAAVGVFGYAAVIGLVAWLDHWSAFGWSWLEAGRVDSDQVADGQWWRTFTALTLHSDARHLLSNLVFGGVFGLLAGRILGGGVAWLAIVVGGALGNFANAIMRGNDHWSIGASTGVFAALGIMVAHALRPRSDASEKLLRRWSPLIAGVTLLAMTGLGGERTDVAAHVTGFIAGLIIGWAGCRLPHRYLASQRVQALAGAFAIGLVAMAWCIALVGVG